jgi:hypothetical protein
MSGTKKWKFVIAAVPHDGVGLGLGTVQYRLVVDPRVDDVASFDMALVLLSLLDGHVAFVEISQRFKPLYPLGDEVTVRHRFPDDDHLLSPAEQLVGDFPGRL